MKLLIDIPEHIYEHAKEMTEDSRDEGEAMRAIANGTPARCMDEAEKERLIKKNMLSIENRVRNVFNQGYEMGVKKNKSEIPNTCEDAISRKYILDLIATKGANLDDDLLIVEQWIQDAPSVNPHPIECGDAISRQAVLDGLASIAKAKAKSDAQKSLMGRVMFFTEQLPSVTPQQRTGRWIGDEFGSKCSCCGIYTHLDRFDMPIKSKCCPNCGAKMEAEE